MKMQILPHLYGLTIFPARFVSTQAHALVRLSHLDVYTASYGTRGRFLYSIQLKMVAVTPEEMANWSAPNYVNPETRVNLALGWILSTMTLMLIFLAARLYSRAILKAALGADDWAIAAAAVRCSD